MKRIGTLVAGILVPASFALATNIGLSTNSGAGVAAGTPVTVSVNLTGGELISGAQVVLFIGDGGPDFGGTTDPLTSPVFENAPSTTSISTIVGAGYIFGTSNNAGNQYTRLDISNPQLEPLAASNATQTSAGTVTASGLLATFLVTTNGAALGTYPVTVNIDNSSIVGAPIGEVLNTSITIIPEPATALMLIGALPFLRRRTA